MTQFTTTLGSSTSAEEGCADTCEVRQLWPKALLRPPLCDAVRNVCSSASMAG